MISHDQDPRLLNCFPRFALLLTMSWLPACAPPNESLAPAVSVSSATTDSPIAGEDNTIEEPPSAEHSAGTPHPDKADQSHDEGSDVVVTLATYDEQQAAVKKLAGKVVIMDIWSTSCIPCMREFPNLIELAKKYPEKVACISLNIDYIGLKSKPPESYLSKIQEFLERQQATIINLASSERDEQILAKYEVSSMPAILIYDAQGKLHKTFTDSNTGEDGLTYAGDVIPVVEELLSSSH